MCKNLVCETKKYWHSTNFDPGKRCVDKFRYKGYNYTDCTDVDTQKDGKSFFWCATKVNEDGELAEGSRHWGECNEYCRRKGILKLRVMIMYKFLYYAKLILIKL